MQWWRGCLLVIMMVVCSDKWSWWSSEEGRSGSQAVGRTSRLTRSTAGQCRHDIEQHWVTVTGWWWQCQHHLTLSARFTQWFMMMMTVLAPPHTLCQVYTWFTCFLLPVNTIGTHLECDIRHIWSAFGLLYWTIMWTRIAFTRRPTWKGRVFTVCSEKNTPLFLRGF